MGKHKSVKFKEVFNVFLLKIHILPFISALRILKILEIDYGHFRSVDRWRAIDKSGEPIPWFTYPAIDYLKSLDLSNKKVFEYGSGFSTLFWCKRAKYVVSIENNKNWFSELLSKIENMKNLKLLLCESRDSYISAIQQYKNKFDLIIIDGLYRQDCSLQSIKKLSSKGMIILDNAERYPKVCAKLRNEGLIQIDYTGLSPINPYVSRTSFFISKQFIPTFN